MTTVTQWFQKNKSYCKFPAAEIMNFIRVDEPKVINYTSHPPILGPKNMPPQLIDKAKELQYSRGYAIYNIDPIHTAKSEKKEKQNLAKYNHTLPINPELLRRFISPNQAYNIAIRNINKKHTEQILDAKEFKYYKDMINRALK